MDAAVNFEKMWELYDTDTDGLAPALARIAETLDEFLNATDRDRIVMPKAESTQIKDLLVKLGILPKQVVVQPSDGGLEVIRILRNSVKNPDRESGKAPGRYLGLELKRILLVIRAASRLAAPRN